MNNEKVAIIGGGPAGLSASICLSKLGCKTIVFSGNKIGGQLLDAISVNNFIGLDGIFSGKEIIDKIKEQALNSGATFLNKTIKKVDFSKSRNFVLFLDDESTFDAEAVIISTGKTYNKLNINSKKYVGRGLSYCVKCDAPFFKNKIVGVVGSGDSAIKGALYLSNIALKVYVFIRGTIIKSSKLYYEQILKCKNVIIKYNSTIENIDGEKCVEQITIKENNIIEKIKINGLFVLIGSEPLTDIFKDYIKLDNKGYIITDMFCKTNIDGVFAAGDVQANTFKQAPIAIGNGYTAGISAYEFINNKK